MSKPKFYQAKLVEVEDVIKEVYPKNHKYITLEERLGEGAKCEECGDNKWWLLPKESIPVKESGKQYCECLSCGYQTHL